MALTANHIISTFGTASQLLADFTQTPGYMLVYAEDGSEALEFAGCLDLEFTAEGQVVSVPIEQGSFASYNKVESPGSIRTTLAIEGADWVLQNAVDTLNVIKEGTDLLNFITPIQEYQNYSLEKFMFQQAAERGLNVLFVELSLIEVKEVEPEYTDAEVPPIRQGAPKNPADTSELDKGKVQAEPQQEKTLAKDLKDNIADSWNNYTSQGKSVTQNVANKTGRQAELEAFAAQM